MSDRTERPEDPCLCRPQTTIREDLRAARAQLLRGLIEAGTIAAAGLLISAAILYFGGYMQ